MRFTAFKAKAKVIHNRLSKLLDSAKTLSESDQLDSKLVQKAKSTYNEAESKNSELSKALNSLFENEDAQIDEKELEYLTDEISDIFLEIDVLLKPLIQESSNQNVSSNENSNAPSDSIDNTIRPQQNTQIRLPKLNLKQFDGNISNWTTFYNLFETSINSNISLSNIEKFQFLISTLSDEPLSLIKSLPLTNENYEIAYDILVKRYHNSRLLKSVHINHLLDMPECPNTNAKSLRHFISSFQEHSSALTALDPTMTIENPFLTTILLRKFPTALVTSFESKRTDSTIFPTAKEFLTFLENECVVYENALLSHDHAQSASQLINSNPCTSKSTKFHTQTNFNRPNNRFNNDNKPTNSRNTQRSYISSLPAKSCLYCNEAHSIYTCNTFSSLTVPKRREYIKSKKACFNCLSPSHMQNKCNSKSTCRTCNRQHHSLLHDSNYQVEKINNPDPSLQEPSNTNAPAIESNSNAIVSGTSSQQLSNSTTVLLGTAAIHVSDSAGKFHILRALIDPGSQASFMTEKCASELFLKRKRCNQSVTGINHISISTKGFVDCQIKPTFQDSPTLNCKAIILPKISAPLPSVSLGSEVKNHFKQLNLADPNFDIPAEIDILLGADLYSEIFDGGRRQSTPGLPSLFHSIFGWVIIGKINLNCKETTSISCNFIEFKSNSLEKSLQNFWEIEEPNSKPALHSPQDEYCEKSFQTNVKRNPSGRYVVSLPFKEDTPTLGDSFSISLKCLKQVERNMSKNPSLGEQYREFMHEYEQLGHMRKLEDHEPIPKYYIPHHAVFKNSTNSAPKIRVVFNASAKSTSGSSLNDQLLPGPKLQNDVRDILNRFRLFPIVFVTDICKMYRQILVQPTDQFHQAILWRNNDKDPVCTYLLKTVTYGVTSSAFLAIRTLKQLATDEMKKYPRAAEVLLRDSFVDDILVGCESIDTACDLKAELINLLQAGCFELKKWASNCSQLLSEIPQENLEIPINLDSSESQPSLKVLGVKWLPHSDVFTYQVNVEENNKSVTKRSILSIIARLFDPLGWISPVIFLAKCIMQTLWKLGIDWDTIPPEEIVHLWLDFVNQLKKLETLHLSRFILTSKLCSIQLHCFCDASLKGYSSALYLRCEDESGNVTVNLVIAKSKVAPVKPMTVPRLELCGALLLSRLTKSYTESVKCKLNELTIYAWSDSMVVLSWIQTPPHQLKMFVANRVTEIQDNINPTCWRYVPSQSNPADCGSRGLLPEDLIDNSLWWNGPEWLSLNFHHWPKQPNAYTSSDLPELKPQLISNTSVEENPSLDLLNKYSSLIRLQRVTAYVLRFIYNCKNTTKKYGSLSTAELSDALLLFVKQTQKNTLFSDLEKIKNNIPCSSGVQRLDPYLDEDGIIRVGGRLRNSALCYDHRHPILLPKSGDLVEKIIDFYHLTYFHVGPRALQAFIQRKYWILSARSAIRKRLYKCVVCARFKSKTITPFMADLPSVRTTPARAFLSVGVDFGGPFLMKTDKLRKPQIKKAYLCLFICMSTKSLHLEIVSDLTTEAFLAALDRLIARRGICKDIYCDQGSTFKGACNDLKRLIRTQESTTKINDHLTVKGIDWHFNPPYAPNFGGIWEAGIKSAKYHLKRVVGNQVLTFEELSTLFVQIEAILNSRPLCPLSSDPNEFDVLTPAHFLIGESLISIPHPDISHIPNNRLSRWQLLKKMKQQYWKRWSLEYLNTLQQRAKWTIKTPEIKAEDIVLVKDLNLPPQAWKLARVMQTIPGSNNVSRIAKLRTASGNIIRPMSKLCPLPVH